MKLLKLTFTIITAITFTSCTKNTSNEVTPDFNGTYKGRFYYQNSNPASDYKLPPGTITVTFTGGNLYNSTSPFSSFTAAARGSYTVDQDNHNITFADSTVHTANFDWNLILTGLYKVSSKDDSILLVKTAGTATYNYKIKKQ